MNIFKNASWIWYCEEATPDTYGDFKDTFIYKQGRAVINLSVDGDYELYVNGKFVNSNQYGDFEHYKIYDSIDITDFLKQGENELYILVWHIGFDSSRYKISAAGLLYELLVDDKQITYSGINTMSRQNPHYKNGYQKLITAQMGLSFLYDANCDSQIPYSHSVIVDKKCQMFKRPIKKLEFMDKKTPELIKSTDNYYLFDLGSEEVGVPYFEIISEEKQKITVAWGEHIIDGKVRLQEGHRNFTCEYITTIGLNKFVNHMLRLGCRYLEIHTEAPIEILKFSFIPHRYIVKEKTVSFNNELDEKIYQICLNSLHRCMLEHYVDTPWREQSCYVYDSRNQMLCGYKAFEDKNRDYARANLVLISKDNREDGLLSITYPSGSPLAIPSFSLHYFTAVKEYVENTGDITLAEEVFDKLISLTKIFVNNIFGDLVFSFGDKNLWNFYDWSPYMNERFFQTVSQADLVINCLFIIAMENLKYICEKINRPFEYSEILSAVRKKTKKVFFREKDGLFFMNEDDDGYTELGNSLAILSGLTDKKEDEFIAQQLANGKLLQCSLSMKCFKYDAMISVDEKYHKNVIDEIRANYGKMLDFGSTTVWEVVEGANAFADAGSLCHGWSAVPILYLEGKSLC